jgi:hypothetical protein
VEKSSLAIRENVEEELPFQNRVCGQLPLPLFNLMTGLFPDVFLPSGQIAVGPSGAFYELRYSGLKNKQPVNETFLWKLA